MTNRWSKQFATISGFILYLVVIASTRGGRYPFDDEALVLTPIASKSFREFSAMCFRGYDFHPPLSYFLFFAASRLGLSVVEMQWLSALFTASALTIWCWLAMESTTDLKPALTIPIALLFALSPLAISQGDAVRWYPLFTLLIAISYAVYLEADGWWWLSAIPLGLAADCEFIALLPFAAILIHRYLVRRSKVSWDGLAFSVIAGVLAIPAFITAYSFELLSRPLDVIATSQITLSVAAGALANVLGFMGGSRLGTSFAWLVLTATALGAYLALVAWTRRHRDLRLQRMCQLIATTALLTLPLCFTGFAKPRSFLFVAPMVSAVIAIGFVEEMESAPVAASAACVGVLAVSLGVVANLQISRVPFKRNLAIPYEELVDFVSSNSKGSTEIFTSDLTTAFSLRNRSDTCVAHFNFKGERWTTVCPAARHWDRVIVVEGNPLRPSDPAWKTRVEPALAQRELIAQGHFGFDHTAAIKNRITGASLSRWILLVNVYR